MERFALNAPIAQEIPAASDGDLLPFAVKESDDNGEAPLLGIPQRHVPPMPDRNDPQAMEKWLWHCYCLRTFFGSGH